MYVIVSYEVTIILANKIQVNCSSAIEPLAAKIGLNHLLDCGLTIRSFTTDRFVHLSLSFTLHFSDILWKGLVGHSMKNRITIYV